MKPPDAVVSIDGLTRRFGEKVALDGVSLEVPPGSVYGLVGENGAGKTTLIKHVLGLLRAQRGSVRVMGLDPVREPVNVLSRVGYLSEERDLPGWMRLHELIRYMRAFYPTWDDRYAEELREKFDLDPLARVKTMSQGQRARAGLLVALAYRPDLLVLDEPSTGLDPVVRREILAAIIQTMADGGRTVVFSSHLLEEVERVSDHVAMLDRGRLVLCGRLDDVRAQHRRVTLRFDEARQRTPALEGTLVCSGHGREWTAVVGRALELIAHEAAGIGARIVEESTPSLDEIFVARVGRRRAIGAEK
jgi:ABC-2 type transport system ATP-binding protein